MEQRRVLVLKQLEDAKKTQEQIALLAKNLGNLNHVYGNMLSAMQGRQS